jgi:hypothetical protein
MYDFGKAMFAIVAVPVLSLALSGCGGPAMLDHTTAIQIHSIEMVGPPQRPYLVIGSGAVVTFILAGPILGAVIANANARTDFDGKMNELNVHVADELRQSISDALRKNGIEVTQNVVERFGANLLFSYSDMGKNSDAILDATLISDYVFDGVFSSRLAPLVTFQVRLVDAKTHKALFSKEYVYGVTSPTFPSDPRYTFADGKSLESNPELAGEGLRASIPLFTAQLQKDLGR